MRRISVSVMMAYLVAGMAGASDVPSDFDPNKPPVLELGERCQGALINSVMPIWPINALRSGASGWTVVRYDLDGSGLAKNTEIASAAPPKIFDKATLDSIRRSKFRSGFINAECKALFVFSLDANK